MKVFFNQLFDYNFYCNRKLIEACSSMKVVPEKSMELFSHILNAHHIWNSHILGKPPEYLPWQLHEINKWGDIHYENQRSSFEITTQTDNFEKRIDYQNSEGRSYANTIQDILFQIINHSEHHRGQIAVDFRTNGLEPLSLEYIKYKR
ncbi:MAG: DinB family protein [Bacteroidota bacterium]